MSRQAQVIGPCALNCIARWKIGNIGNIVVNQQLNRQQMSNRPATDRQHF
jgi:hypothetical protein